MPLWILHSLNLHAVTFFLVKNKSYFPYFLSLSDVATPFMAFFVIPITIIHT